MADVRFSLDDDQLRIITRIIRVFTNERAHGETLNLLHSIAEGLGIRLERRLAERRLEYKLILPVHQAITLRRMAMAGLDLFTDERTLTELRIIIHRVDPLLSAYLH